MKLSKNICSLSELYSKMDSHPSYSSYGDEGSRTPDLRLAKPPLSQLSYIPESFNMGLGGVEPPTSRLSGVRSNQLSYRPKALTRSP